MSPKVSILVPVYGVEKFIEHCAISLFEQTFESIEYIFVNDCTIDNSMTILNEVIRRYPVLAPNIHIINNEVNKGIGEVRNILINNAVGEYVLFVDSDDYIENDTVEQLYNNAVINNSDIVTCDILVKWENSQEVIYQDMGSNKVEFIQNVLSATTILGLVNKLVKRDLFVKNNISISKGINYGEDYLILPKVSYFAKKITKVNLPLYNYLQINPNSYTTQKLSKENINNIIFVMNSLTTFFEQKDDYTLYKTALLRGKLRKKMDILFFSDYKDIKSFLPLFPETNDLVDTSFLLLRDRLGYRLVVKESSLGFKIYRCVYKVLFQIKRKLKMKH